MDAAAVFGKGIAFPPRLGRDGRWAWSVGPTNIQESIQVILLTELNERLMTPEFGVGLQAYLFQPNVEAVRRQIEEEIVYALRKWEPRVALTSVIVEPDSEAANAALATIEYRLVATQTTEQLNVRLQLAG